jgi:uncharacterized protein (TIGR02145 family)
LNYDPALTIDNGTCEYPSIGDISMDGLIDVSDIVMTVDVILVGSDYIFYMDLNRDNDINIVDVVMLIDVILNPYLFGCTDDISTNYNPEAYIDAGNCEYTDIDGNIFHSVTIGDQLWMAENLKVTHYQNGDSILMVISDSTWTILSTGAYCYSENDMSNFEIYGALYNWFTIEDNREVCPIGWHVPSDEDFIDLEIYLGMSLEETQNYGWRGVDEGGKLKEGGIEHWSYPNVGATNESSFTALPAGSRNANNGISYPIGSDCTFWLNSENSIYSSMRRSLLYNNPAINRFNSDKRNGYSIRCIRDVE